ncbi:hypothetical protein N9U05_00275 [bacterium]|jgi:hypothetical protein|nr:hypothetical protein [bacterium]
MTAVKPFLDIQMGIAATITDTSGTPLPVATQATAGLSSTLGFDLAANVQYVARIAAETTRPNGPPFSASGLGLSSIEEGDDARAAMSRGEGSGNGAAGNHSALGAAVALATAPASTLASIYAEHREEWMLWWNASTIDLGPSRQILESFYYGAQYMLRCFSRPGGTTSGLLGPWSLQDPVGWSDHLTTDYNGE